MKNFKKKKDKNSRPADAGALRSGKYNRYFFLLLLFVISALYFIIFGSHIFYYQENQSLFIYSWDYFREFAVRPGGLLEYAGNFIAQGYYNPVTGSLILSSLITIPASVFLRIGRKIVPEVPLRIPYAVLPSCVLMLFSTDFNFHIVNNLGFLAVSACFLLLIDPAKKIKVFPFLVLFPLFYYVAGAFVWIIAGMYVVYCLINRNIIVPLFVLIIAIVTVVVFKNILFLQPLDEILSGPLPSKELFRHPFLLFILYGLFVLSPLILKSTSLLKINKTNAVTLSTYSGLLIFAVTIFGLSRLYNPEFENFFRLEKMFCRREWGEVIKFQEKIGMKNLIAQYYYNISLAEKDLLCDRMFNSNQDYGTNSIMLQWDSKVNINQIFRGAYFFYTIGLINEAHRWAYESMVVQGFRPENLKMLIKTELISRHYKMAGKYINILKKTMNYRDLAKKYEKMAGNPELIEADPELGGKRKLLPVKDFIVKLKNQQENVLLLLQANPGNRQAFEYMMAWFMLERNVDNVCNEIQKMKGMGYTRLPRHIEEAAVWYSSYSGRLPDLGGLKISDETIKRFAEYRRAASQTDPGKGNIKKISGNTFWYYLEFR